MLALIVAVTRPVWRVRQWKQLGIISKLVLMLFANLAFYAGATGHLDAGIGWGGSCFPKDVRALAATAREHGYEAQMLNAVEAVNARQKQVPFALLNGHFADGLAGLEIALWGLSFKPNTDDMREAPSRVLMEALWEAGATVRAYDPEAAEGEAEAGDQQARALVGWPRMVNLRPVPSRPAPGRRSPSLPARASTIWTAATAAAAGRHRPSSPAPPIRHKWSPTSACWPATAARSTFSFRIGRPSFPGSAKTEELIVHRGTLLAVVGDPV